MKPIRNFSMIVILIGFSCFLYGQNLIPNPSFEASCEQGFPGNGYFGAAYWYNANAGTFDYYTLGNPESGCGMTEANPDYWVSYNEYQVPFDGNRMVGGIMYCEPFCIREMIQCKLLAPLEADRPYCFSMRVCLSGFYDFATNGVGIGLSNDSVTNFLDACTIDVDPFIHLENGQILADTMNWYYLTGNFIASGSERYLTLGNLRTDAQISVAPFDGGSDLPYSYYYFDDLHLELCNVTNVAEEDNSGYMMYPNPVENEALCTGISEGDTWKILDATGRCILSGMGRSLDLANLRAGIYFVYFRQSVVRFVKS